jgi:hypothetical protein
MGATSPSATKRGIVPLEGVVVLGVDEEHAAGPAQGVEDRGELLGPDHQAFLAVGQVALDGRGAGGDDGGDAGDRFGRGAGDDGMDAPVHEGPAGGLVLLAVDRPRQGLAVLLVREIDDRGHPAEGRGARAGRVVVDADRAHEGVVEVDVGVDGAGEDEEAGGVDELAGGRRRGRDARRHAAIVSPSMSRSPGDADSDVTIVPPRIRVRRARGLIPSALPSSSSPGSLDRPDGLGEDLQTLAGVRFGDD